MADGKAREIRPLASKQDACTDTEGEEEDDSDEDSEPGCNCDFISAISNFAIQYNYNCASIATRIMLSHKDITGKNVLPDFPEPEWVREVLHSGVFIGSIVGMLLMGYLGDILGIRRAIIATNALVVISALSSALLSWGSPETVWTIIAVSRFFLGVGVGGNYPLSAAKAAGQKCGDVHGAVEKAGRAFFWQGPGSLAPYLVALLLLKLPPVDYITAIQFRVLLGLGAVPAFLILLASINEPDVQVSSLPQEDFDVDREPRSFVTTLLGTAGTWLLFDIAYYGTVLFAPELLQEVFGPNVDLTGLTMRTAILPCCGIAGTVCGIWLLHRIGAKKLNLIGLLAAAAMFIGFWALEVYAPDETQNMFLLTCALFALLYGGPNIATYVLPVMSFPPDKRSTYHGRSGAAGKVGAMLGCLLFPIMSKELGTKYVLFTQAVICVAAALVGQFLIKDLEAEEIAEEDGFDEME